MIEAEIKARLRDPEAVVRALEAASAGVEETYTDTYFDTPEGRLDQEGRELRVRTVAGERKTRHVLTYKRPAVDATTGSKPELETTVGDPDVAARILADLGYPVYLAFTKECRNYHLERHGRRFLATVVRVPELDGTFLEVETTASPEGLAEALTAVRELVADLGVTDAEHTTDTYTGAVRGARERVANTPV